jgi:glycine cleavage system H protein
VAVNTDLSTKPELVNKDPHGTWLFDIELNNPAEVENLLDNNQYADLVK